MAQYNTVSIKLFNSHLSKLKSEAKAWTVVILNPSSNLVKHSHQIWSEILILIVHINYY